MADYKKPDYWQLKARKEGYPARSVYKLIEIDEKFSLFKSARHAVNTGRENMNAAFRILDIGAAPGSWSLHVLRKIKAESSRGSSCLKNGFLAAADLCPLSREFDGGLFDMENFFFIQGDVTEDKVLKVLLSKGPFSVIISDAAPNTTGNHMTDSARSLQLAETVISYAETSLANGGNLALKIFQGSGIDVIQKRLKMLFGTVKSFKPLSCRSESVETYFIGLGKK